MKTIKPIPQELLDQLVYDPTSPTGLRWRQSGSGRRRDLQAGSGTAKGYWSVNKFYAHRVVWALHHGDPAELMVDHIDGDRRNNRIENLQAISQADNSARQVGRGYCLHKSTGKWVARIRIKYEEHHLGLFDTEDEARAAYLAAKAEATEGLNVTL